VSAPRSLEFPRQHPEASQEAGAGLLRRAFLRLGGYYSRESRLLRGADGLAACLAERADDPALAAAVQLPPGFQAHHALMCLHVWLLLVRLRAEGAEGKDLAQMLYDSFQEDVERRVRRAGVKVRLSKQLTELEKQFYGSSMAYDKALKGEAGAGGAQETLAAALQRNVYLADAGKAAAAAALERYCLRELACLAVTDSGAVMAGNVKFSEVS
jgi:cytochrome b pre-mRNA-processing protein 3